MVAPYPLDSDDRSLVVAWYFDGQVTVRNTTLCRQQGSRPEVPAPSWWPSFLPYGEPGYLLPRNTLSRDQS